MKLLDTISKSFTSVKLKAIKYAPEIEFGLGLISFGLAIGTTVYETLRVKEVLDEEDDIIKNNAATDKKKEEIHRDTLIKVTRLYLIPTGFTITGYSLTIMSFTKMKKRYLAAVAAYNAVNSAFIAYRERVIKSEGIEKDREYLYGVRTETKPAIVDENGQIVEESDNSVNYGMVPGLSPYSIIFKEELPNGKHNANWDKNRLFNITFLRFKENEFNDRLEKKGIVFLNEVYDALGFPPTKAGAVVGWVRGHGDSVIDFGLYHNEREGMKVYIENNPSDVIMDFNVDGVIYDLI